MPSLYTYIDRSVMVDLDDDDDDDVEAEEEEIDGDVGEPGAVNQAFEDNSDRNNYGVLRIITQAVNTNQV